MQSTEDKPWPFSTFLIVYNLTTSFKIAVKLSVHIFLFLELIQKYKKHKKKILMSF